MKGLNFFQAATLAMTKGYAIRPEPDDKWYVRRFGLWLLYTMDADSKAWLAKIVPQSDFTDAGFLRKDYTTDPWEGGSLPPCATPVAAGDLPPNASGGAGAWSYDQLCAGAGQGGGVSGGAGGAGSDVPRLNYFALRTALHDPATALQYPGGDDALVRELPSGLITFCPAGFRSSVFVEAYFLLSEELLALRKTAYLWLRVNGTLAGPMAEPYVFGDGTSALTGAAGPVSADPFVLSPTLPLRLTPDSVRAGYLGLPAESSFIRYGLPVDAFDSMAMQPGDVLHARVDLLFADPVARYSFFGEITLPAWKAAADVAIEVSTAVTETPDGERHYWNIGVDGVVGVNPDTEINDDVTTTVLCWSSTPDTQTIHVEATATGGKMGPAGTMTLTIGAETVSVSGRTATHDFVVPYSDAAEITGSATYDQPADENGPAVTFTQSFTQYLAALCASLADSIDPPP